MDQAALKKALRKEMLAQREALDPQWVQGSSRDVFHRWRNRFSLRQVAWMHIFQSIENRNEIDTRPFMEYLRFKHARINIVVPVIDRFNDKLRHAFIHEDVEMVKNRWGIPEPKLPVEFVPPMLMDMVLVPLLAFDLQGNRLGYGKGYYDAFLAMVRPKCLKVGLAFDFQKVESGIPIDPHDVPLDFVVTEANVYRLNENLTI